MKKLFSIVTAATLFASAAVAQEMKPCGLDELRNKIIQNNPSAEYVMDQYEEQMNFLTEHPIAAKSTAGEDTIPVIFHIVLNKAHINLLGGPSGIAARCNSQIAALNRDYNAANADSSLIPAAFKPLYGNANIKFALAHTTPQGGATPGYTIDTVTVTGFDPSVQGTVGSGYICSDAKYSSNGGADGWNAQKYMNVWVVNTAPGGTQGGFTAGIAMHPSMTNSFPLNEWGVVIHFGSFGQRENPNQYFVSSLEEGRVLVHEIGHYLGLWHTWGNDQGGCQSDDGIADTPPQDYSTQSYCPTFPLTDACSPNSPGVMYMNYMDYASEDCQHMFSKGQVARFNTTTTSTYPQLVTNPELTRYPVSTAVSTVASTDPTFTISPNPAKNTAYINMGSKATEVQKIIVTNGVGQVMNIINPEAGREIYSVDLQSYASGMYYIQCQYDGGNRETQKLVVSQ
jgi:hypothetical protein